MANDFYFPSVGLKGRIQENNNTGLRSLIPMEEENETTFADVVAGVANDFNSELNAPEKLLKRVMSGDSSVDIHDVMTSMAKAEIDVNIATQVTSKVIQAYERIIQISV